MSLIINLIECVNRYLITNEREYVIPEGMLRFLDDPNKNNIYIHSIFLNEEYQKKGILTDFLTYLSDNFDEIWFYQCNEIMGTILMTTKLYDKYFINRYTGEYYWFKHNKRYEEENIIYDSLKYQNICDTLKPMKNIMKKDIDLFYSVINLNYREYF